MQILEKQAGSLEAEKQGGRRGLGWASPQGSNGADPVPDCKLETRHRPAVSEPE